MAKITDIAGRKFNRLTPMWPAGIRGAKIHWLCLCDCGQIKNVDGQFLRCGNTKSCGCLRVEVTVKRSTSHGQTAGKRSSEYVSWMGIIQRCTNPLNPKWKEYGGRGITVCERWLHSFANFFEDMGYKPSPDFTIDRIENDGNYEPENCRWASQLQQQRNRRPARRVA